MLREPRSCTPHISHPLSFLWLCEPGKSSGLSRGHFFSWSATSHVGCHVFQTAPDTSTVSLLTPRVPRFIVSQGWQSRGGPKSTGQEKLSKLAGSSRSPAASESMELADRMGGASDRSRAESLNCCPAGCTCTKPHRCPYRHIVASVVYSTVHEWPRYNDTGGVIAAMRNMEKYISFSKRDKKKDFFSPFVLKVKNSNNSA